MKWYIYVISALGALALGSVAAFVNMELSKIALKKNEFALIMGINIARFLNDALILAAVYFICMRFELPLGLSLISAAVGMTLLGMIFLELLTKKIRSAAEPDGGE